MTPVAVQQVEHTVLRGLTEGNRGLRMRILRPQHAVNSDTAAAALIDKRGGAVRQLVTHMRATGLISDPARMNHGGGRGSKRALYTFTWPDIISV